MKRILCFALALLLLTGCSSKGTDETTAPTTAVLTEPTHPGYYEPDSETETQSSGAILSYALPCEFNRIETIGLNLLLIHQEETLKLTVLKDQKLTPVTETELPVNAQNGDVYQVLANGIVYYTVSDKDVVYLDGSLKQVQNISLPEDISGSPVFSTDGGIYFVQGTHIRGIDPDAGVPRLIKDVSGENIVLTGCYFAGRVLSYSYTNISGETEHIYISAETGEMLADGELRLLETNQDAYFAVRQDGVVTQYIFGTLQTQPQSLTVLETEQVIPMLPFNSVLYFDTENNKISLCDLSEGKRVSEAQLLQLKDPALFCGDAKKNCIWFAATENETKKLFRWDFSQSSVKQEAVLTGALYTQNAPDEAGLAACAEIASGLKQNYGVDVRLWQDAVKAQGEYTLVPEHQVPAINQCLLQLDEICKQFPDGFLKTSGSSSASGRLRVCIVREISGGLSGVQYWQDGQQFIVLSSDADVQQEFVQLLSYAVISRVLGNSAKMDYWTGLNPKGFQYDAQQPDTSLTEGEKRAFVDAQAMTSLTEDRSLTFFYAMSPENQDVFTSETMQSKLKLLCQAIREAYKLKRYTEVLPWEQYLNESLAYKK